MTPEKMEEALREIVRLARKSEARLDVLETQQVASRRAGQNQRERLDALEKRQEEITAQLKSLDVLLDRFLDCITAMLETQHLHQAALNQLGAGLPECEGPVTPSKTIQ